MKLNLSKSTIYIIIIVVFIAGYSLWINVLKDTISKGDSYVCDDILGDKYNISVSDVEYLAGIMTVSLSIYYDLADKAEENDKEKAKAAINVFLDLNACLESNGVTYKPVGVTAETDFDFPTDKWATAELSFLVDDSKQYALNIKSDRDLVKFSLK